MNFSSATNIISCLSAFFLGCRFF